MTHSIPHEPRPNNAMEPSALGLSLERRGSSLALAGQTIGPASLSVCRHGSVGRFGQGNSDC